MVGVISDRIMRFLNKLIVMGFMALLFAYPAAAAAPAPTIAVFPLQDLSQGRNGINLDITDYFIKKIETSGTRVIGLNTVIAFMSHNRIRSSGELETYYINLVREELRASYVLLGTVVQNKEVPILSLGLILHLVRTYDGRTVWTYVNTLSSADFRKLLEVGEPRSIEDLLFILSDDIMSQWPGDKLIREEHPTASIDSVILRPEYVTPGGEMFSSVNLRNLWAAGRVPKVFFKADDQIYSASPSPDGNTFKASWIASEKDGRFPVTLILEWPLYGRTETFQVGSYVVDGVPPLIAVDLKGESLQKELPVFRDEVIVVPRRLIRKPIVRWHISFRNADDMVIVSQTERRELPEVLVWGRRNSFGGIEIEGEYEVELEVWDQAGNSASTTSRFELNNRLPAATLAAEKKGQEVLVDINSRGKVPLAFWRMEMWSKEGRLLKTAEGTDLPVQIGIELQDTDEVQDIEGKLVVEDILGNRAKQSFANLLRPPEPEKTEGAIIEETTTKSWVEEF